ncbi:MAG TPA: hypothetical protein VER36_12370, partial [Flavisolibacter sp.]|nr:hypothetical protein [Flavisolibacter sp.]
MSKAFRKEEGISFNKKEEEEKRRQRKEKKAAFSEERLRYEFEMLKDPKTGKIPKGIFEKELLLARTLPEKRRTFINGNTSLLKIAAVNNYIPAGPNNIGGRTRALLYDRRYNGSTNRVIIAGCVSGGIMRSANGGNNWVKVTPEGDIHNFTAIAQDTRPGFEDTWYAGGGESYGNTASELGAAYLGFGLWKSTNNGASWTKLPMNNVTEFDGRIIPAGTLEEFDHPFDYVHRIAINPVNGHVYVAGHRRLLQSTDGGASFQTVFGSNTAASPTTGQMDISISNTGRVFLAVNGGNPDAGLRGVWVSPTGNRNSFSRIAGGSTLGIDSVSNWRGNAFDGDSKRILLTLAPSNPNIAYVFYENGLSNGAPAFLPEADLFRLDIAPTIFTWSNRSANMPNFPGDDLIGSDPLAVQNGYDMLVAVKPDDPNIVFVGGTNLYRSSDGFATANNTAWINGYNTSFTYQTYPNGHADIHSLAFNPSANNEAICGDDGGIRGTSNISAGAVSWNPLPNYQTLQYYYVAIDPDAGKNNFAGGAQDNGTLLRDKARVLGTAAADSNNHVRLSGGDGSATGISRRNASNNTQYVYAGSQFGTIRRIRIAPSLTTSVDIRPNNLTTANQNSNEEFGEFVTNFRLNPDNTEDLYYVNFNRLFRTTAASSVTRDSWTELTGIAQAVNPANPASGRNISIRAIAFSRGAYAPSHCLFLGS